MRRANVIERLLQHDRAIVLAGLVTVIIASWVFILKGSGTGMSTFAMTSLDMALGLAALPDAVATPAAWTFTHVLVMFFMWWIMMLAMMLPSATPMILLHAKVSGGSGPWPAASFSAGYIVMWAGFSAIAVTLQWLFESAGVLHPMMMNSTSTLFAGSVLLFAGAYQFSPVKQACLKQCQGPLQFLSRYWEAGEWGAFRMGLRHGALCLGCCWGLMLLLFFGGIMNLYWIAGLALLVLVEKLLPAGRTASRITGGLLVLWGLTFIWRAWS